MSETESAQAGNEVEKPLEKEIPIQEKKVEGQETEAAQEEVNQQEQQVPLSALQKERKKRQDAEQRARVYEEIQAKALRESKSNVQQSDDDEQYEAVTKADLSQYEKKITRQIDEKAWIRQNPEKTTEIEENLAEFLTQRPHLKYAIEAAPNRYEEAYTLMNALSPKQKTALKPNAALKKDAPGSPTSLPKAAGMNQAVDVMAMNDTEYLAWRKAQKQHR